MRKIFSTFAVSMLSLALAACGGGDSAFGTPAPGGTSQATSIVLTTSANSVPSDGSASADISALVRDANNNAMSGMAVTFSTSAGSIAVTQGTTDATGVAKATLSASGAAVGTTMTVTAKGGGVEQTLNVTVANTQQTITVVTSSPQIPSDGSIPAKITALVRGANNQLLKDVPVSFSASSGGLAVVNATTDANGAAVAQLTSVGDPSNRRIVVTATAGSSTATVPVDVVGTKITVVGAASLVLGAVGTYDIAVVDSAGNGIPGITVTVASALQNALSAATLTTDANGRAAVSMTATVAGADKLTASALGQAGSRPVAVSDQNFVITRAGTGTVPLGAVETLTVTWTANGVPQANKQFTFATTRGLLDPGGGSPATAKQATTDGAGKASITLSSPTSGPATVTAAATGVNAELDLTFIATNPTNITVQFSPSTIPTQGKSNITATVRDAVGNLVQDQPVNFQLTDITGGSLSLASAVTDGQGTVLTVYTASQTASASEGVVIKATLQNNPAIFATAKLTVAGQALQLSLGTGTVISENLEKTQFLVPYTVRALDASGVPVNGATITMSVRSLQYGKGTWEFGTAWNQGPQGTRWNCPNEDLDFDGFLDPGEDSSGLGNNNGVLDPGGVAATSLGQILTAADGSGTINVIYPQDHAGWVQIALTAKAVVQGTESSTTSVFWLPMLAAYLTNQAVTPPGRTSPYGVMQNCTNKN